MTFLKAQYLGVTLLCCANLLQAQCATSWQAPDYGFGTNGPVEKIVSWDPDGMAGPQLPIAVFAGEFTAAGSVLAENIAFYDPATQVTTAPASGTSGRVRAILASSAGDLIVGGEFPSAGAIAGTQAIARFDGNGWTSIGGGLAGTVYDLAEMPNGDLIAVGSFVTAGVNSTTVNNVARWDGASWQSVGGGTSGIVAAATIASNGDLVVGGYFLTAGSVPVDDVARWDGTSWFDMGSGLSGFFSARQLLTRQNNDLMMVGTFGVSKWNGSLWQAVPGLSGTGEMFESAFGRFYFAKDGSLFAPPDLVELLPNGPVVVATGAQAAERVLAIADLPGGANGDLLLGGSMSGFAGANAANLVRFSASTWSGTSVLPTVTNALVRSFATAPDGTVYAGGSFSIIENTSASRIAQWDGTAWQPLGTGLNGSATSLAVLPNGDLYVAGGFSSAGGVAANGLARWDGNAWYAVTGSSVNAPSRVLARRNGRLVVAGFSVAELDQTGSWNAIPNVGSVDEIFELPDGRLAVSGYWQSFGTTTSTRTAIWDGVTWELTTPEHFAPYALGAAPNGDLVVSAGFQNQQAAQRWDGASWQQLGIGLSLPPETLTNLPNGDLVAGGQFRIGPSNTTPLRYLARFDGLNWQPLAVGTNLIKTAHFSPTGTLFAAAGSGGYAIARRTTDCPASVVSVPSACVATGSPQLIVNAWPYLGATYEATSISSGNVALVVDAYGTAAINVPVSALFGYGAAGCTLHLSPILFDARMANQGIARSELVIPNTGALVGAVFGQQAAALQFDLQGAIIDLSMSNSVTCTIGSYQ